MADFHRVIGIDLGTTFSAVAAYSFDKQHVEILPNLQGHRTTPSVVYVNKKGEVSVGRAARKRLTRDPGGVVFEAKRLMGSRESGGKKELLRAAGREIEPEMIAAYVLKELKRAAEKMIGEPVHDAVITVPAYFKEPQKNATREAARIAKLNPRLLINEPTAAAVAYGLEAGEEQTFVVYDFGGGTFDVSVVKIESEDSVAILGTGGDANLGGGDIDQRIVDWALDKMQAEHGTSFRQNEKIVGRVRLEAEQVKIQMCNQGTAQEFALDNVTADIDEVSYMLEPDVFGGLIRPLLDKTFTQVDAALASARESHSLELDDVEAFILVGGSSKIPWVKSSLEERYSKEVRADLNPDEIVAMGAARMALNYQPSMAAEIHDGATLTLDESATPETALTSTHIKDVVSHTLGIGLKDDVFDQLIPRDHVIPHKVVRKGYSTAEDNQTSIFVPVFQGDNARASFNEQLGKVVIDGLAPERKGAHTFQVTFALDADGIFHGEILHEQTGQITPIVLDRGQGQITEKRRIALSESVDSGTLATPAGSLGGAEDPHKELIERARAQQPRLPADKQRDLDEAIDRLARAKELNNLQEQASAVVAITMILTTAPGS